MVFLGRHAVLCLALLSCASEGFRAKHRAASSRAGTMQLDPVTGYKVIAFNGCQVPDLLFSGVRSVVNNVWAGLNEHDPASLRFAGNRSFKIITCGIDMDVDANISLAGFSEGGVRNLACDQAKCLQKAADGSCANTEYDFSAHLSVGDCKDMLTVAGGVDADWSLCGKNVPRHVVDASFDLLDPGVKVQLSVQHQGGVKAKISKVSTLDINWGTPSNFKCGFEGLPGFVGGLLSDWCQSLMEWVAGRIEDFLKGDVDKWLLKLLNKQIDLMDMAY